jgi:NarL family two-component system response regulator LiaR
MQQVDPIASSPLRRVLIVDDMPQVRQDLRLLLQVTGELEIVAEAANGIEAITAAEAHHPDVVLMDLEMPILDGYEATRQIKARHLAAKVIILTIHAGDEITQRIRQSGADEYLLKGASFETLMNAILTPNSDATA